MKGPVRMWDAADGSLLFALGAETDGVDFAAFSRDGARIVTVDLRSPARVWDGATGRLLGSLEGGRQGLEFAIFSPDGRRVLTTGRSGPARICDAVSGKVLVSIDSGPDRIESAAFSPDGASVATVFWEAQTGNRMGKVWNAADGRLLFQVGDAKKGYAAMLDPAGRRILTADIGGVPRVWDASDGRLLASLDPDPGYLESAAFSADGGRLLTLATRTADRPERWTERKNGQAAEAWDAMSGRRLGVLEGHLDILNSAAFGPDGGRVLTTSQDQTSKLWSVDTGGQLASFESFHPHSVTAIDRHERQAAFSPDGKRVVTTGRDRTAVVWEMASGRRLATLSGHTGDVHCVAWSPDGRRIGTGSDDGSARLWNADDGRPLAVLAGHRLPVVAATFSPDGRRLVTVGLRVSLQGGLVMEGEPARVWDADGKFQAALGGPQEVVTDAVFSPDGARLVTLGGAVKVWSAAEGRTTAVLEGHKGPVESAAFSPDGKRVVTAGNDGTARIWDAEYGRLLVSLEGHVRGAQSAAFSPDGSLIVTTETSKAEFWDSISGKLLATIEVPVLGVDSASYSPDGTRLITKNGYVATVWDVHPETRGPAEVSAWVERHAPWRLVDGRLMPAPGPAPLRSGRSPWRAETQ